MNPQRGWRTSRRFGGIRTHKTERLAFLFLLLSTLVPLGNFKAFAQTKADNPPDILGLNLSMSRDQAISYLQTKLSAATPRELTEGLVVRDYMSPPIPVGYITYIVHDTPTRENSAQAGNQTTPEELQRNSQAYTVLEPGL